MSENVLCEAIGAGEDPAARGSPCGKAALERPHKPKKKGKLDCHKM